MDEFERDRDDLNEAERPGGSYYQAERPGGQYADDYSRQAGQYGGQYAGDYSRQAGQYGGQYAGAYSRQAGQGYYGEPQIPPEVRKWNWGAFTLNWIWGCGNGAYLALLCLVPFLNLVWVFVCGAKGNEWAWKSGKFKDLDTFLATQRTWNIAGIILFCIYMAYVVVLIMVVAMGVAAFLPWSGAGGDTGFIEYDNWG